MAPETRPRARGRGRPGANPMPGSPGRNKGIDPAYSGPARGATRPGGGTPAPAPAAGRGRPGAAGGGAKPALGGAQLVGPGGRQLSAKVSSGAITSEQAKRTLGQRQTLAKALGPNWRDKLTVGGESFAQVNKQLKANPGNAKLAAIRKKLTAKRATVLAAARDKNKGAGEGEEAGKKKGQE